MSRLVLTAELLTQLRTELLKSTCETCAILYGRAVILDGRLARIVVRDVQRVADLEYQERSNISAQLSPEVIAAVAQKARKSGESIIFAHSHPFPLNTFSPIDDKGEKILSDFLAARTPGIIHAALLVTPEAIIARVLGGKKSLEVVGVGSQLLWGGQAEGREGNLAFDRQLRVFGEAGQKRLRAMRVGIVGLGGTGSIVLEQLTHLGVGRFLLIDPDVVERTNLNRLVGATEADISRPKVETAAALARRINPNVNVEAVCGSVLKAGVAELLADTDFLFCCTDSHGSRAVLNQFAYQYLVPAIDMGVGIGAAAGTISHISGRTQMLAPGLACLQCGELLNPEAVRVDLLTDYERAVDPYIIGTHEPAPAVISINATMASMSVTMFLAASVGIPCNARLINYNGITGGTRFAENNKHPNCIVCSSTRAIARANEWPLPVRLAEKSHVTSQ